MVCPELLDGHGEVDAKIRVADPEPGNVEVEASLETAPGRFELLVPGVARYVVEAGNVITVTPVLGADEDSIRLFLLGTGFGALLHQRGVLPLHGAAVRRSGDYVVIVGRSGDGKSSLAAALRRRGWAMATDDLSAIRVVDDRPYLSSGYPETKMWPDVLEMLGDDAARYPRVRAVIEKRRVAVDNFAAEPGNVAAVVVLQTTNQNEPVFTSITGGAQMTALKHHTYRAGLSLALGSHRDHFATITCLARRSRMWLLERPREGLAPDRLAERLETHLLGQGLNV